MRPRLLGTSLWACVAATSLSWNAVVLGGGVVFAQPLVTPNLPVRGTVTDETGGVLPGAVVVLLQRDASDPIEEVVSDGDGNFSLSVPAGEYLLRVSMPSFATEDQVIRVTSEAEPLTVRLGLDV